MPEKDFDQYVRDQLKDYSSAVPGDMWRKISGGEADDRKAFLFRKWYVIGPAVLAFCLLAGYFVFSPVLRKTSGLRAGSTAPTAAAHPATAAAHPATAAAVPTHAAFSVAAPHAPNSASNSNYGENAAIKLTAQNHTSATTRTSDEGHPSGLSDRPLQQPLPPYQPDLKPQTSAFGSDHPFGKGHPFGDDHSDWYLELMASPDFPLSRNRSGLSYSFGVRIIKTFGQRWSAITGLQYSQINLHYKEDTLIGILPHRYEDIDLPLLIGYRLDNPHLNATINAGVVFNLYSRHEGELYSQPIHPYLNSSGFSLYLGMNLVQPLSDRFSLIAEPYIRHQLSDMVDPFLPPQRIDVAGIFVGIRYSFKRPAQWNCPK